MPADPWGPRSARGGPRRPGQRSGKAPSRAALVAAAVGFTIAFWLLQLLAFAPARRPEPEAWWESADMSGPFRRQLTAHLAAMVDGGDPLGGLRVLQALEALGLLPARFRWQVRAEPAPARAARTARAAPRLPDHCRAGAFAADPLGTAWHAGAPAGAADPHGLRGLVAEGFGEPGPSDGKAFFAPPSGRISVVGDAVAMHLAFAMECEALRRGARSLAPLAYGPGRAVGGGRGPAPRRSAQEPATGRWAGPGGAGGASLAFHAQQRPSMVALEEILGRLAPSEPLVLSFGLSYGPRDALRFYLDARALFARLAASLRPRGALGAGGAPDGANFQNEIGAKVAPRPVFLLETWTTHHLGLGGEFPAAFHPAMGVSRALFHLLQERGDCLPGAPAFDAEAVGHGWRGRLLAAAIEKEGLASVFLNDTASIAARLASDPPARRPAVYWLPMADWTKDLSALHPRGPRAEPGGGSACIGDRFAVHPDLFRPQLSLLDVGLRLHEAAPPPPHGGAPPRGGTPPPPAPPGLATWAAIHRLGLDPDLSLLLKRMSDGPPDGAGEGLVLDRLRRKVRAAMALCPGPASAFRGPAGGPEGGVALCVTFRNEAEHLAEWASFHRVAGASAIFACDDGSTDFSVAVLAPFLASGLVTLLAQAVAPGEGPPLQIACMRKCVQAARDRPGLTWLAMLDADEFLMPAPAAAANHSSAAEDTPDTPLGQPPPAGDTPAGGLAGALAPFAGRPCFRARRRAFAAWPHLRRPAELSLSAYRRRARDGGALSEAQRHARNKMPKVVLNVRDEAAVEAMMREPSMHDAADAGSRAKCAGLGAHGGEGAAALVVNHYSRSLEDWAERVRSFSRKIGDRRRRSVDDFLGRQWDEVEDSAAWERYGCAVAFDLADAFGIDAVDGPEDR